MPELSVTAPKALIFDVFGTVVDWRSGVSAVVAASRLPVDPLAFADAWRARYQPKMEEVRSGGRPYTSLDDLHRENLDYILADQGLEMGEAARADLNRAWEKLPPWPDSVPGLTALKTRYIVAPCSNGSIAMMTRVAKFGGLPWDCILGADIARDYKPVLAVYRACSAALRLDPSEVMMVAAHNSDLHAARDAGLMTAFFPRPTEHGPDQTTDLAADSDWDVIAEDIEDLARRMASRSG